MYGHMYWPKQSSYTITKVFYLTEETDSFTIRCEVYIIRAHFSN